MRFYGFQVNEIVNERFPHLDLDVDPKLSWALRHPEQDFQQRNTTSIFGIAMTNPCPTGIT